MSLFNKLHNVAHAVGEYVTPVLSVSAFEERGVLTPEEFVQAGDQLVRTCPTWEWASGDPKKRRSYLPENKQFLITRGVTCEHRVKSLEENFSAEEEVEGVETEDTWLATHNNLLQPKDADEEALDLSSMGKALEEGQPAKDAAEPPAATGATVAATTATSTQEAVEVDENEDGFVDLDDFVEDGLDDGTGVASDDAKDSDKAGGDNQNDDGGDVVKMRTYDLSITYDKYYQTPRVWLYGYDEHQNPLSGEQVLEDIMQDYANKTVTIEPHPQLAGGVSYASIHPCRHADVMKKIVSHLTEGGKKAEPSQYLFMFLKFIQSVIPTINYDNTFEVQAM